MNPAPRQQLRPYLGRVERAPLPATVTFITLATLLLVLFLFLPFAPLPFALPVLACFRLAFVARFLWLQGTLFNQPLELIAGTRGVVTIAMTLDICARPFFAQIRDGISETFNHGRLRLDVSLATDKSENGVMVLIQCLVAVGAAAIFGATAVEHVAVLTHGEIVGNIGPVVRRAANVLRLIGLHFTSARGVF